MHFQSRTIWAQQQKFFSAFTRVTTQIGVELQLFVWMDLIRNEAICWTMMNRVAILRMCKHDDNTHERGMCACGTAEILRCTDKLRPSIRCWRHASNIVRLSCNRCPKVELERRKKNKSYWTKLMMSLEIILFALLSLFGSICGM